MYTTKIHGRVILTNRKLGWISWVGLAQPRYRSNLPVRPSSSSKMMREQRTRRGGRRRRMKSTVMKSGRIETQPRKHQLERSGATRFSESERISGYVTLHRGHSAINLIRQAAPGPNFNGTFPKRRFRREIRANRSETQTKALARHDAYLVASADKCSTY